MNMEQILLGIGLIAVCVLAVKAPKLLRRSAPLQTARAQVISRGAKMNDGSYSNFRGTKMRYQVTFSTDSGTLELSTDSSQYTQLLENTWGKLTWQGDSLVSFIPDTTS